MPVIPKANEPGGAGIKRPSRRLWALVCALAALAACLTLIAVHRTVSPNTAQAVYTVRPVSADVSPVVELPSGSVNVNTADEAELQALPGVGTVLAAAIVAERADAGPFDYPEDLVMVPGIGVKTLSRFFSQLDFTARAALP